MCGIAGIAGDPSFSSPRNIKKMTDAIAHRGPDDEGFLCYQDYENPIVGFGDSTAESISDGRHITTLDDSFQLVFGHRRLSIIDTSFAGHQPMVDQNGNSIVFNGAIYNYVELKQELEERGHVFRSSTDTEVILKSYETWGEACVDRFNGMFAFVVFDATKRQLFGARDRVGVKPFYYVNNASGFGFASEHKALLPLVNRAVNTRAAFSYLVLNQMERETNTIFEGIEELPQGCRFVYQLRERKFKVDRYYTPPKNDSKERVTAAAMAEHVSEIEALLKDSIAKRLRADVPIGSALSGGIDSSTIVGIMNDMLPTGAEQNVFTSSFKDPRIDESKWASQVVEKTGVNWEQTYPTGEGFVADIEQMTYHQDIPLRSTSTYAQFKVMELAKASGVKVLLDGQGGDELFGGYVHHLQLHWRGMLERGRMMEVAQQAKQYGLSLPRVMKDIAKFSMKYSIAKRMSPRKRHKMFSKYFHEFGYLSSHFVADNLKAYEADVFDAKGINSRLRHEYFDGPMKELLKCEDRSSMQFSIESRTPLADDTPLMEYVFSVPGAYKMYGGVSKVMLREAAKNYLPASIYERKDKLGFVTPNNTWIREQKDHFRQYFESLDDQVLDKNKILKDYDTLFDPKSNDENYRLFKLISFAVWHKRFEL